MKRDRIIYWAATGLLSFTLILAGFMYLTDPRMDAGFTHFGFPAYFRIELAIAKLIGATVLIVPGVPSKIKEWAYVATAIVFTSAFIAHTSVDGVATTLNPLISICLWVVSVCYFIRIHSGFRNTANLSQS